MEAADVGNAELRDEGRVEGDGAVGGTDTECCERVRVVETGDDCGAAVSGEETTVGALLGRHPHR